MPPDSQTSRCSLCQAPLAENQEYCVRCLLKLGLNEAPGSDCEGEALTTDQPTGSFHSKARLTMPRIDRYKLLEQIGEGGCGVVYVAEQENPAGRRVALKVIKVGMDTRQVIARFEAERQALALMDHPNIAKVLDAGATEAGKPYFVMELVEGQRITQFCDENHLSLADRLTLFVRVCQAIQHAHQKGIIHRDIKPSNILVAMHDGVPVPKVIDFGIAKATSGGRLTDKTVYTAFDQFIGTPAYMSPEQAQLGGLDIDTRSDIYALGVLLYELLTGRTPFDANRLVSAGLDEIRRIIREEDPPRPSTRISTLNATEQTVLATRRRCQAPHFLGVIRGDLDWIVMKTLEKNRTRRYGTANELGMDITRHLNNEPVQARPPSSLYRVQKLVRRNKLTVIAGCAIAAALIGGLVISTWGLLKQQEARREANKLRIQAEAEAAKSRQVARFLEDMLQGVGQSVAQGRDTVLLREIMEKTAARVGRDLTSQPEVEEELRGTLGNVYLYALSDWAGAEAMLRPALVLRQQRLGDSNLENAPLMGKLGEALLNGKHLDEAQQLDEKALAITRAALGNDNDAVAQCLGNLGTALREKGRLSEAEKLYREALAIRQKLFEPHDQRVAEAVRNLASLCLRQGKTNEARAMYREAAENGDGWAQFQMYVMVLRDGTTNFSEAIKWIRKAAEHNNSAAQNDLGWYYYCGQGIEQNTKEAEKWFRKSADQGNSYAQDNLGGMYEEGVYVEKNYNEAAKWYRLAASRDHIDSLYSLGRFYEEGKGVPKDAREAAKLYERAAALGNPQAQLRLAWMYEHGLGESRNDVEAANWYRKAAERRREVAEHGRIQDLNNFARFLATCEVSRLRDGPAAILLAEKAVGRTNRQDPTALDTLAAAYAETGLFDKAVIVEQEAIDHLTDKRGQANYAKRLNLYKSSMPYREP